MNDDIIKSGWVEKEFPSTILSIFKYKSRFLILTPTHLKYFHNDPLETQEMPSKSFSVIWIDENFMLEEEKKFPNLLTIECGGKINRFRCTDDVEAKEWRNAIVSARAKANHAKVHFDMEPSPVNRKPPSFEPFVSEEPKYPNLLCSLEASLQSIDYFEQLAFTSLDRAKHTANRFFESVQYFPIKERGLRAKEMGKILILWLTCDEISSPNSLQSPKSSIFTIWLRTALSREFLSSCKFDENGHVGDDGDASSESSSMTHSTIKSRMKAIRKGSIIMPFRADTPECLFISSIFHHASIQNNFLYQVLNPILRPLALQPELYTYPKPGLMPLPTHDLGAPLDKSNQKPPVASRDEKINSRNSLSRRSIRIFTYVRNAFNFSSHPNTDTNAISSPVPSTIQEFSPNSSQEAIVPTSHHEGRPPSVDLSKAFPLLQNTPAESLVQELAMLSPLELTRLEVRKRLLAMASELVHQLSSLIPQAPLPIKLILETIRDLIIIAHNYRIIPNTSMANVDPENSEANTLEGENTRQRFEFGTYYTSCTALLFLRLICRAIVAPDDYGVTLTSDFFQSQAKSSQSTILTSDITSQYTPTQLCHVTLVSYLSHTFSNAVLVKQSLNKTGKEILVSDESFTREINDTSMNISDKFPLEQVSNILFKLFSTFELIFFINSLSRLLI